MPDRSNIEIPKEELSSTFDYDDLNVTSPSFSQLLHRNDAYYSKPSDEGIGYENLSEGSEFTSDDLRKTIVQRKLDSHGLAVDPNEFGKQMIGSFQDPNLQNQYMARYEGHKKFNELGFSPTRDNESLYNANSTFFNELGRASHDFVTLTKLGFADMVPLAKKLGFDTLTDAKMAAKFEAAMARGSSSKGGTEGFATNLFLNFGYTAGIMAELAVEEGLTALAQLGLGVAGVFTGGSAWTGNVALAAKTTKNIGKAAHKIKNAKRYGKVLSRQLKNLGDINHLRNLSKMASNSGTTIAKFLNPLDNSVGFVKQTKALKKAGKIDDVKGHEIALRGLGSLYLDSRAIRAAHSEGSLEGGMVQNTMEKRLYDEFQQTHGRIPTPEEAVEISLMSHEAGVATSLLNMPLIFYSNKIVFDGLLSGRYAKASMVDGPLGKVLFNPKLKGKGKKAFNVVEGSVKNQVTTYAKNPRLILNSLGSYASANWTEGFQEIGQEAVAMTTEEYYADVYSGDVTRGGYMQYVNKALKAQVSHQGVETFLSGFLMGGIAAPVSKTIGHTMQGKESLNNLKIKFSTKDKYVKLRNDRKVALEEDVEKLNQIYADPKKYLSQDLINLAQQNKLKEAMDEAEKTGDYRALQDLQEQSHFSHIITALKYNRFDSVIQELKASTELTEDEFKGSYDYNYDDFNKGIALSIERAEKIKERWDFMNETYPNPHDPGKHSNKILMQMASEKKEAWDAALIAATFQQASFDRALERSNSIMTSLNKVIGLEDVDYNEISATYSRKEAMAELVRLGQDIEGLESGGELLTPESKALLKNKKAKLKTLKNYISKLSKAMDEMESTGSITKSSYNALKSAFANHMKTLGSDSKSLVKDANLENALNLIIDKNALDNRMTTMNANVNTLLTPAGFSASVKTRIEIAETLMENRKEAIRNSLKAFRDVEDKTGLRDELLEANVFMDVADWDAFIKSGAVPKFYAITDKGVSDTELDPRSKMYKEAVAILEKYLEVYNLEHLTNIVIPERMSRLDVTRMADRENDTRTYAELAKQFGFADKESVLLKEVLKAIMDSKYATDRDKELAAQLFELASDKESITFIDSAVQAVEYTDATSEQTIVDARYASAEYKDTDGVPIEFLILKGEVQRRIKEGLKNDAEFKKTIQELYDTTVEHVKNLSPEEMALLFKDMNVLSGLNSIEDFVSEIMSNEAFQKLVGTIPTDMKTKSSVWLEFINKTLDFIEKVIGIRSNGTVLNAALDVITTKLNVDPVAPSAPSSTGPSKKTNPKTPAEETDSPTDPVIPTATNVDVTSFAYPDKLVTQEELEFIKHNQPEKITQSRIVLLATKTPDTLTADEKILLANEAIRAEVFNLRNTINAEPVASHVTQEMKEALKALGFSASQASGKKMNRYVAHRIIHEGLTVAERSELLTPEVEESQDDALDKTLKREEYKLQFTNDLKNATTGSALKSVYHKIKSYMKNVDPELFEVEELEKLYKEQIEELKKMTTFDTLAVGETVVLSDDRRMTVESKDADGLMLISENEQYALSIKKEDVPAKIKYKLEESLDDASETETKLTQEDKKMSEEARENYEDLNSPELMNRVNEKLESKGKDEIENNLFNSICK